jgi:conjugative transposon TraJ protein
MNEIGGMQAILDNLYATMMPLCKQLIGVGQGIAGFAALWYIAIRVWRSIANAETVEVFPLLRPFVLGFAILVFPSVLNLMNGVLSPTVTGTQQMLGNANASVALLLQQKENAIKNTASYRMLFGPEGQANQQLWDGLASSVNPVVGASVAFGFEAAKAYYNFKNRIRVWIAELLELLYEAAALCISTLRTFQLLVLSILGPLVFGLAVFDGFQHTLLAWIARYINVYLWLAVANILGTILATIQAQMIQLDINQIQTNGSTSFGSTDAAYLIFLLIGIVSYFTVPTIASYIVNVGGGGALTSKTTGIVGGLAGRAGRGLRNMAGAPFDIAKGWREGGK